MKKPVAKRQQEIETAEVSIQQSSWSGPLPPPQALHEFDQVVPGGAERIMAAWEKETAHRQALEKRQMELTSRELILVAAEAFFSKISALIFVLAALGVSAYAIQLNQPWFAGIFGSSTIAAVVWAFIHTKRGDKK